VVVQRGAGGFVAAVRIAVAAVREDGARLGELDITFACFDQAMLNLYGKEFAS
jgi:hypothetical protein